MTKQFTTPTEPPVPVQAEVAPQPVVAPQLPESTLTLADPQPARRERPKAFYVSSQWHILPGELDGYIEAVNNTTGDRYSGTIVDFNDMLRGD